MEGTPCAFLCPLIGDHRAAAPFFKANAGIIVSLPCVEAFPPVLQLPVNVLISG